LCAADTTRAASEVVNSLTIELGVRRGHVRERLR